MAWGKVKVENKRRDFMLAVKDSGNFAAMCRQFEISRPTGYKWLNRWDNEGDAGLSDRSSAPHSNPNTIQTHIEKKILEMRFKYSKLGPKKILVKLRELDGEIEWPCASTIGNIFDRNGLTVKRKRIRRVAAEVPNAFQGIYPNEVWCMDFKGTLRTKDNKGHDPFTLMDSCSRFLLKCQLLQRNNTEFVWTTLDAAFREYGLPKYILSDNGPPFATQGLGRLSRISIKLIKAGVTPIWITPGRPQQNGRLERMHRTMELELGTPAANTITELKGKLQRFQDYYNLERPHEALEQLTPGKVFCPSERNWHGKMISPEYGVEYQTRKVQKDGTINFNGERIFIGETFYQEYIGLLENEMGWQAYFGSICLGNLKNSRIEFKRM